jgi:hypothetical protein
MPPLPSVSKVLRLDWKFTTGTDIDVLNRIFVEYSGTAPTNTQLNTFCGVMHTAWDTNLRGLTPSSDVLVLKTAVDLSSPTAAIGEDNTTDTGNRTGTALTAAECLVVSHEVQRRYRGGHPRTYWHWGVAADLSNTNTWSNTFTGAVAGDWASAIVAVLAGGWSGAGTLTHVNVSYYKGFTLVTSPTTGRGRNVPTLRAAPVVDPITSYVIRPYVGSQRRRNEARR